MKFILDTGANLSVTSRQYANALGLSILQGAPHKVRMASGEILEIKDFVEANVKLTDEAEAKLAQVFILSDTAPGDFILLGIRDLEGYALTVTDKPSVHWIGLETEDPFLEARLPSADQVSEMNVASDTNPSVSQNVSISISREVFTEQHALEVQNICNAHAAAFGPIDSRPANLPMFHVKILPGYGPVAARLRHFAPYKAIFLREEVAHLLELGVLVRVESPWSAGVVVTPKRNGGLRFCTDYVELNDRTEKACFPMPIMDSLVHKWRGCKFLGQFDFSSGYHQIPVHPDSQAMLAFSTEDGQFTWTRMPFGVCNGPCHFQRVMVSTFGDIEGAAIYQDDLAFGSAEFEQYKNTLEVILSRCEALHLKINAKKSHLGPKKMSYLGYEVSPEGIKPDPERLEPLRNMPSPKNKDHLRSFLGMVQYFSRFIKDYGSLTEPFWSMLRLHEPFVWGPSQEQAFQTLKSCLLASPLLVHPDPTLPLTLRSDASVTGIGGVLYQMRGDQEEVLSFISRRLTENEKRFCTIELECLAVIYALEKARPFIHGPIKVVTDHSNLLFTKHSTNRRVQRWSLLLQEYPLVVEFKPGRTNAVADALSRLPPQPEPPSSASTSTPSPPSSSSREVTCDVDSCPVDVSEVELCALEDAFDPSALPLRQALDKKGLREANGVLTLSEPLEGDLLAHIFAQGHSHPMMGHFGFHRTYHRISRAISFPGMREAIQKLCRECVVCQKNHGQRTHPHEMYSTAALFPFESVFIDFIGPLPKSSTGNSYILCCVDRFSRWVELIATPSATAEAAARALHDFWFTSHGLPVSLVSDGGSHFDNRLMKELSRLLEVNHHIAIPYHPQSVGVVERMNRTVVDTVRAILHDLPDRCLWDSILFDVRFALNSSPNRATGITPYQILHGFPPRLPLHAAVGAALDIADEPIVFANRLASGMVRTLAAVQAAERQAYERQRRYFLRDLKQRLSFSVGDYCLLYSPRPDKLSYEWNGPFLVVERLSEVSYRCENILSHVVYTVHLDRMRPFLPGSLTPEQLLNEAAPSGEFVVEAVTDHRLDPLTGELSFRVKWLGFEDGVDPWVAFHNCDGNVQVANYIKKHKLGALVRDARRAMRVARSKE
jgi:hypothetical protein